MTVMKPFGFIFSLPETVSPVGLSQWSQMTVFSSASGIERKFRLFPVGLSQPDDRAAAVFRGFYMFDLNILLRRYDVREHGDKILPARQSGGKRADAPRLSEDVISKRYIASPVWDIEKFVRQLL